MQLQTNIPFSKQSNNLIDYHSNILLVGSCFSDNIGKKLDYFKFQNLQNPFGILFQPKAIESLITNAVGKKQYSEKDIFFYNEQWHGFDAHSKLSSNSKDVLLHKLNEQSILTNKEIVAATHIIITLGTAWVYRFIENNRIVANCHKVPQNQFSKELLSVDEVVKSLTSIISAIKSINSNATIIFTVSPVRHIKDGFVENTRSKAQLISAIHQVINNQIFYFPSYELMMDELRDYRFYAEDMIHPNQIAINYIWEKFQNVWISQEASKTMDAIDYIQKGLLHKPFNSNSEAHQLFLKKIEEKQQQLKLKLPFIRF